MNIYTEVLKWFDLYKGNMIRIFLLIIIGLPILKLLKLSIKRGLGKYFSAQFIMLFSKSIQYLGGSIILIMVLRECGFKLTALFGAAGIAGVAIGFASQTSLSNLISGLFLVFEKPFQAGDVLDVGGLKGIVHSIDLLSIKIRTFDNKLIRIPNENLIKSNFTNITHFPIRRHDVMVGVAYKEDVDQVIEVLKDIADKNPYCLDEPEPIVIFREFGESSLDFLLGVYFAKDDFIELRNSILRDIKQRFDEEGIEIPFPHRTIYTGAVTAPFPVRMVNKTKSEYHI